MPSEINDSYLTITDHCSQEIKIKGSRFIGLAYPVENAEQAMVRLEEIRKKEHAANHHCFAYVIGIDNDQFKYSDDGEPSGTAGKPIHQVITGRNLKNVLVIVVRYFGGTKLGTGGLARAYSQAAVEVLEKAKIVERLICDRIKFTLEFGLYDQVMRLINTGKYTIIDQDFAEQITLTVDIRKSQKDNFIARLKELSGGKVEVEKKN